MEETGVSIIIAIRPIVFGLGVGIITTTLWQDNKRLAIGIALAAFGVMAYIMPIASVLTK